VWKFVVAVIAAAPLGAVGSSAAAEPMRSNQLAQAQTSTPSGQLDMEAVPNLNAEGIRQVQQALAKKGFDPGPIDGVLGPQTEQALRKFQDYYGIKVTGRIDNQTLYALGEAQLAGQARQ
jgi:peptidoglycan hydrolase-like protein with peptidoglycan-binding domain